MNTELKPTKIPELKPGAQGGKRDANRKEKTQQIADAALKIFLLQGVEKVTIDDIVKAAGVAKGSFYRYFADKEALVAAILAPMADQFLAALSVCAAEIENAKEIEAQKEIYMSLAQTLAAVVFASPDVLRLYLQEKRGPLEGAARPIRQTAQKIGRLALETTQKAHGQGLLKPISPEVSTLVVVGAVEELLFQMLSGTVEENWMELPAAVADLIFYGLRKDV